MTRLLIVEDEKHLATGLKFNLEAEGYAVDVEETGEAARDRLVSGSNRFDLLLLDVMLPGIDGFEVVQALRDAGNFMPVMMLTARGHTDDVLRGFELGADDYLTKPFDLSILVARIQGLLRRKAWLETKGDETHLVGEEYRFGACRVDFGRQVLERDGTKQPLTVMEATLLRYLIEHEGQSVSRRVLLEEVWGVRKDTDTRTVDNFIARLRRVIEDHPSHPQHLQTVRGVGYRFVVDAAPDSSAV